MNDRIDAAIDDLRPLLEEVALTIHGRPELRFEERFAAATLVRALASSGIEAETCVGGLETAFRARVGRKGGGSIAVLAEYDALPEIGHACGHNLIAAGALGAFLGAAAVSAELPGEVVILGTPAEEGGGGKIDLLDAGAFEGIEAAMMFHPLDRDVLAHGTLASVWLEMEFTGTASHAALAPWDGSSALSAVIQTFNLVDSQRVHMRDGTRVHGFITDGGQAVNIIPEHAACEFSVRAPTSGQLDVVQERVSRCARAAAAACGVTLDLRVRRGYRDLRTSTPLIEKFAEHLESLGRRAFKMEDEELGMGSTDMGDVSHRIPAIHPFLAICEQGETTCHQVGFVERAASRRGIDTAVLAAKAMARTAVSYLTDDALRLETLAAFAGRTI